MNQTHRESEEERRKNRRIYVCRLALAKMLSFAGGTVALSCALLALLAATVRVERPCVYDPEIECTAQNTMESLAFAGILAATLAGTAFMGGKLWFSSLQKAQSLSYVPSVREQAANLPAAEILLRGAKQSCASPQELVRAAAFNEATLETDLLRAADSENGQTEQRIGGDTG